jgi:hypothetical protein
MLLSQRTLHQEHSSLLWLLMLCLLMGQASCLLLGLHQDWVLRQPVLLVLQ